MGRNPAGSSDQVLIGLASGIGLRPNPAPFILIPEHGLSKSGLH